MESGELNQSLPSCGRPLPGAHERHGVGPPTRREKGSIGYPASATRDSYKMVYAIGIVSERKRQRYTARFRHRHLNPETYGAVRWIHRLRQKANVIVAHAWNRR